MMTSCKIVEYVSAEPFRPFRFQMASGQSFEIRHPEMIMVGRNSVRVDFPPEVPGVAGDRWKEVSSMLTETVEPIAAAREAQS